MKALEITTTIGCKIRCDYCPQDTLIRKFIDRSRTTSMNFDAFELMLQKLPSDIIIHFSGMAEPWLNPECTKMVLLASRRGHEISVYTTAVGMRPSDVDKIKSIPFRDFVVHLPDQEGHARIDVNDCYLETLESIVNSNIKGCKYMTMGTLPKRVQKVMRRRILPTRMMSRAGNLTSTADIKIPPRLTGDIRCISCGDLFDHNVLLPNGDVILCCMDYGLQHVLGNLLESDYDSLFHSGEFQKLKAGLTDESIDILCRHCENASSIDELACPKKRGIFKRIFCK